MRWLLDDPTLQVKATLSGEFQFVLRQNDVLLQVQSEQGPFLMLAESQLHFAPRYPVACGPMLPWPRRSMPNQYAWWYSIGYPHQVLRNW